ncbi:MAG TPA: hypothetical protein VFU49_14360, partial [Ktedonobacteraceae bacterium]|nr:hypothetical protein [Ktedonobacteraceae bacterium]
MSEDDNQEVEETLRQWQLIEEHYKSGKPLIAQVIEATKGKIIVDVSGIRGVVEEPVAYVSYSLSDAQHLSKEELRANVYERMKGKHLQLKVIAMDRKRNHLLLTQRLFTKEEQEAKRLRREQLLRELRPGDVRRGIVTSLRSIVATIDIYGIEGLLFQ